MPKNGEHGCYVIEDTDEETMEDTKVSDPQEERAVALVKPRKISMLNHC